MFCHKCGTNNREEASFCKKCGAKLIKTSDSLEKQPAPKAVVSEPVKEEAKKSPEERKHNLKKVGFKHYAIVGVALVVLILCLTPEAKAYYGYFNGMRLASKSLSVGNYIDAVKQLQAINQHGLYKTFKNQLNQTLTKYSEIKVEDDNFKQAKQDEQSGNLDEAKILLISIRDKNNYPKSSDVIQELSKVNDAITAKVQADAVAKVAAAQQQAQKAAAQAQAEAVSRKKAEQAAADAAANAAANQAAAQAAQQEAAQQQAQAQAAQAQAAAAEQAAQAAEAAAQQQAQNQADSDYISALVSGTQLLNSANTEINNAITAYISTNYSLALVDLAQSETDSYNAEHNLPYTYPTKFKAVNNDLINSGNSFNLSAHTFYTAMEYADSSLDSSAFSSQSSGTYYYNQIKIDLAAIGY